VLGGVSRSPREIVSRSYSDRRWLWNVGGCNSPSSCGGHVVVPIFRDAFLESICLFLFHIVFAVTILSRLSNLFGGIIFYRYLFVCVCVHTSQNFVFLCNQLCRFFVNHRNCNAMYCLFLCPFPLKLQTYRVVLKITQAPR
jgi:hypothetical protein